MDKKRFYVNIATFCFSLMTFAVLVETTGIPIGITAITIAAFFVTWNVNECAKGD